MRFLRAIVFVVVLCAWNICSGADVDAVGSVVSHARAYSALKEFDQKMVYLKKHVADLRAVDEGDLSRALDLMLVEKRADTRLAIAYLLQFSQSGWSPQIAKKTVGLYRDKDKTGLTDREFVVLFDAVPASSFVYPGDDIVDELADGVLSLYSEPTLIEDAFLLMVKIAKLSSADANGGVYSQGVAKSTAAALLRAKHRFSGFCRDEARLYLGSPRSLGDLFEKSSVDHGPSDAATLMPWSGLEESQ